MERLASSNDPQSYGVWSLVLLAGTPMAQRSEVRSPTNSDPATTAEQAEEDTYCPNGSEGGRWLQQDCARSPRLIMPPGYGRLLIKFVRTLLHTKQHLLPRAHHQRPMAMDKQRGQDCDIWKSLVTDLHVGGGCVIATEQPYSGSPLLSPYG